MTLQKRIVFKLHFNCEKSQSKALQIAAGTEGVNFVGLEGECKEYLVVVGDRVNPEKLTINLRKKLKMVELLSVDTEDSD
ncbi:unnamed protein product [Linum trigynum]|uniref:HMA domain-containing protein n=2 Tax=Linum TaxID=4005 RepID=A0AAV2C667_9ROSI